MTTSKYQHTFVYFIVIFYIYKMLQNSLDSLFIENSSFSREKCYASVLHKAQNSGTEKLINNV